ncbi:hypothetical protein BPO_1922 [Bergeyella porcorum]|uniref:Uncharacterized protein n=1 Tax=Bergeyella porcorum TaxID=1735111 RepID=A0ABZ0E8Z1_9FLAO
MERNRFNCEAVFCYKSIKKLMIKTDFGFGVLFTKFLYL